jgi:hypothetical protein
MGLPLAMIVLALTKTNCRPGLWRSQFGEIERFGRTFSQRVGRKFIEFRTGLRIIKNPLPGRVTGLMLEKTRKIHDLPRFCFRQGINNLGQFFGNRCHVEILARDVRNGKCGVCGSDAARQKILRDEKLFNSAGKSCFDEFAVGSDESTHSFARVFELLLKTTSSASPKVRFFPADATVKLLVELKLILYGVFQGSTNWPSLLVEVASRFKNIACWAFSPAKILMTAALSPVRGP